MNDHRIILTSRRRAEYALNSQRIGGFAVWLAGDYWVSRDTPRMWRLMHRTTPNNDFVAVGDVTWVLNAWEAREMHTMEVCDCGMLNEQGTECGCRRAARVEDGAKGWACPGCGSFIEETRHAKLQP